MADKYVVELHKGRGNSKDKQFVIFDGNSMENFITLKKELTKWYKELSTVKYVDDEDDIVTIDSEEEYKEFLKLANQRSSTGMLIKMILEPSKRKEDVQELFNCKAGPSVSNDECTKQLSNVQNRTLTKFGMEPQETSTTNKSDSSKKRSFGFQRTSYQHLPEELKREIIFDLKREILSEMRSHMGFTNNQRCDLTTGCVEDGEESDENILPERRKSKLHKKLEKKEKQADCKLDQRLEKLELKKKKLLEKASLRSVVNRKTVIDPECGLPCIMSGIATTDSCTLTKRVTVGKVFLHVWHVINDGTHPWSNVELRHTWSSPGLEPDELFVKVLPVAPGQTGQVAAKFKAPKTIGTFLSYWHFFYQVDSQWQQFGHYLSITGNTKQSKHAVTTSTLAPVVPESKKEGKNIPKRQLGASKSVMFKDSVEVGSSADQMREVNLHSEKSESSQQLASAEIAADMAREAANAAYRSAIGKHVNSINSSAMDQFENSLEDIVELNLVDSGSDSDTNNDDSDPGFVFVDAPSVFLDETLQAENNDTKEADKELRKDYAVEDKVVNYKLSKDLTLNTSSETSEFTNQQDTNGLKLNNNQKIKSSNDSFFPSSKDKLSNLGDCENEASNEKMPIVKDCKNDQILNFKDCENKEPQPMSFPRLDPNVSYPVFPPLRKPLSEHFDYKDFPNRIMTPQGLPRPANSPQIDSPTNLVFPPPPIFPVNAGLDQLPTFPQQPYNQPYSITLPQSIRPTLPFYKYQPPFPWVASPAMQIPMMPLTPLTIPYEKNNASVPSQTTFPIEPKKQPNPHVIPNNTSSQISSASKTQADPFEIVADGFTTIPYNPLGVSSRMASQNIPPEQLNNQSSADPTFQRTPFVNTKNSLASESPFCVCPQRLEPGMTNSSASQNAPESSSENSETPNSSQIEAGAIEANKMKSEKVKTDDKNKKSEDGVHILPQGLVDGAINVAATAYSTAWNALNNLRTNENNTFEFDPVFENNMALLVEMGFNNLERNARLLKRFNNDISQVIGVICATGGAHNLDID